LYVRGFQEGLTDEDLTSLFAEFGELGSVKIMRDGDELSKKFGFVCFKDPEAAQRALDKMNNFQLNDGSVLYVAKLEKKNSRWASLKKSLAKSNLYVRNFDKNVTEDDLKKFFGGDSVVRNVRIMTTDVQRDDGLHKESKQFGFVSFMNPKDAADVVLRYNNEDLEFNNKQLYVNFYEDKLSRKKRLATKKDNIFGILDPNIMSQTSGDQTNIMEYFMQMFQQYFKNMGGAGSYQSGYNYNNYGHHQQYPGGYNHGYNQNRRPGNRPHRGGNYPQSSSYGYQNQAAMYGRPPRQDAHHSYANAAATLPHTVPPPAQPHLMSQIPPAPVASQPRPPVNSATNAYTQTIKTILSAPDFTSLTEESRREKIGEEIYNFVLQKAGEESAPKITGMIIDLPYQDLIGSIQTWEGLQEKIQEGLDLLKDDQ
jgi:polyadenylate-binding protein